jgi:hypothetical protein
VAIGRAAPAADELVPLPAAEFVALASAEDALWAIEEATDEAEAATDDAEDLADPIALEADDDAPDAADEADAPAAPVIEVYRVVSPVVVVMVEPPETMVPINGEVVIADKWPAPAPPA